MIKLYEIKEFSETKISTVIEMFKKYNIPALVHEEMQKYSLKAQSNIHNLSIDKKEKRVFINFAEQLMKRTV